MIQFSNSLKIDINSRLV